MKSHKRQDIEFMTDTSAAILESVSIPAHMILWTAATFLIVALFWSAFATIDEITRGEGKVIPSSEIQVIQNLEGGIVKEILVSEGDIVEKGQVLMVIDDTLFSANLRESQIKILALQVKIARLQAEANNAEFQIADKIMQLAPQMVADEQELHKTRRQELAVKKEILQNEIIAQEQELAELMRKQQQLKVSYELISRELTLTYPLVSEGAASKIELLRLERTVNDIKGELEGSKIAIPKIEANLASAKKRLEEIEVNFSIEARTQLNEAKSQFQALYETSAALADRVKRTMIRSPVKGTVNQVNINTIGGIIQPGASVMEIVPLEDTLLIEAEIRPADIGFLRPNLEAVVKITAYDFSIYGGLHGKVVNISADTVLNERKESIYLIKVRTDRNYLEKGGKQLPVITGMRASVDILTGQKTVLDYILKPILKTKQRALTER